MTDLHTQAPPGCNVDGCGKAAYARGMCCAHYKRHLKARPKAAARRRRQVADDPAFQPVRMPLPELLAAWAAACPPLPGALCRGRHELFDGDTAADQAAARQLCKQCPALAACRDWLTTTQSPPAGVVAQIVRARRPSARESRDADAVRFAALRRSGLSFRAIAAATGTSETKVRRLLRTDSTSQEDQ